MLRSGYIIVVIALCALLLMGCSGQVQLDQEQDMVNMDGTFSGCAIGAFVNGLSNYASFEEAMGKKLAVYLIYVHWQDSFPREELDTAYASGSIPVITWEPWISDEIPLEAISNGSYEVYVREFLADAKEWGNPIFLRFAHEMNGNWYPWDGTHNGTVKAAERYKKAWIYIYNVKEELKADNIKMVWCPNNTDMQGESWNKAEAYYPGDQYVDWVGIDGYNWGHDLWQDFDIVMGPMYQRITALTDKPLMIGEIGSAANGGDKAQWITGAFSGFETKYPRIKIFCWFNVDKERNWRIQSSTSAQAAFKEAMENSYFRESF